MDFKQIYAHLSEAEKEAHVADYETTMMVLQKLHASVAMMREHVLATLADTSPSREEVETEPITK